MKFKKIFTKKNITGIAVAVAVLAAGLLIYNFYSHWHQAAKSPEYQTVLPKGKTISQLGGWKRVSPPEKDPVFAFADTIDGIPISVSQQPLPESFKSDTAGQVAELAKRFNATDETNAGDAKVYIGTSAKGPQSVIFAKGGVLVLIKSQKKIKDASWAEYAKSLN